MVDQHEKFIIRGLKTEYLCESNYNKETEVNIIKGEVQLVYISPESLLNNIKYRRMLLSTPYRNNLMGLVVDEAHCVKTWGDSFRIAFAEIGTLRSLIRKDIRIMALTATCTSETLKVIEERLSLEQPDVIASSPQRSNIFFCKKPPIIIDDLSSQLADEFKERRINFPKTVIFCRSYKDCGDLFVMLRHKLGEDYTEPKGYPDFDEFRMIEVYTRVAKPEKREEIIKLFVIPESNLRLIIATTAFGMGIDCPDISRIFHWGLPSSIEEYVQETGRAGRNGMEAEAILFGGKTGRHASLTMKAYSLNTTICRRKFLYQDFLQYKDDDIEDIL